MSDDGANSDDMRRYSSLVAAGIAMSRLSGLLRDVVLAFFLGANIGADAFRAALRIPNFLQNLLGEGVLSASFIPTYSRLLEEGRDEDAGRVAGAVLGLLAALAGVLVLFGVVFARPLTMALTPGFVGERLDLTVTLVRIMFPGIGLLVLSAWCLGVLNSHRRFFLSYVAPVLWNVGILAALFGLGATAVLPPAVAAGWGVVLGGLLQVAVQVPAVRRLSRGMRVSLDTHDPGVRQVLRAFGPIVAGRGVVQIAALLDLIIASLLAVGAVSVLGYAQTLYLLPVALFGMSVAAAELPSLSTMGVSDRDAMRGRLDDGLARSAFFVVGATIAYLLAGRPIVELLFVRGQFDAATAMQVVAVLAVYSLALLPATASRLLQSVLYATDDARTPAVVAVIRVVVALAIAVPLMLNLDQFVVDPTARLGLRLADDGVVPVFSPVDAALRGEAAGNQFRLGAVGLAVGSVVGAWLEFWLLRRTITVRYTRPRLGGGTLGRLLAAAGASGIVIVLVRIVLPDVIALVEVLVAGAAGGLTYLGVTWRLRVPEARSLVASALPWSRRD